MTKEPYEKALSCMTTKLVSEKVRQGDKSLILKYQNAERLKHSALFHPNSIPFPTLHLECRCNSGVRPDPGKKQPQSSD